MTHTDLLALAFVVASCAKPIDYEDAHGAFIERLKRRGLI
jgi:hypothetical protein